MDWIKQHLPFLISLILNIILCIFLCTMCNKKVDPETKTIIRTEYVPVHDTITVEKERIKEHTKIISTKDTIIKADSVLIGDTTTEIFLPNVYSQYKDTFETDSSQTILAIEYHGILAEIDSINLQQNYFRKETIIEVEKPKKKIGFVWFAGPVIDYSFHGSMNNGTWGHGPGIGIGFGVGIGGYIK